jgi:hypothetical protein
LTIFGFGTIILVIGLIITGIGSITIVYTITANQIKENKRRVKYG